MDRIEAAQGGEYWETMYNHKDICEALLVEGAEVAKVLFDQKVRRLTAFSQFSENGSNEAAYVLLTSLNRSIYNFLLMNLDISLTRCCFACRAPTLAVRDTQSLLSAGNHIIDEYAGNLRDNMPHCQFIKNVCAYIQNHLEDELTIARLCEQMFVSRSYFCRCFRELTGSTFCQYLTGQRLSRARLLLVSTSLSMDEIAAKCGFRSQAYFSSVFRGEMGMTPSVFRRTLRAEALA